MQTSYSNDPAIGFAGMRADSSMGTEHISRLNGEAATNMAVGIVVKQGSSESECLLPSSSSDKLLGLVVSSMDHETDADGNFVIEPDCMASIARKGRFYALPEQTVAEGDDVFVRYTAGAGALTVGRLRKDYDGTAQVDTITPSAVNSTLYTLSVGGRYFQYLSDASATAAEIVAGFTSVINADSDCLATASGTTTLILTAKTAGVGFLTQVGANLALANTTANAAKAKKLDGAKWRSAASADSPAIVELNLPA